VSHLPLAGFRLKNRRHRVSKLTRSINWLQVTAVYHKSVASVVAIIGIRQPGRVGTIPSASRIWTAAGKVRAGDRQRSGMALVTTGYYYIPPVSAPIVGTSRASISTRIPCASIPKVNRRTSCALLLPIFLYSASGRNRGYMYVFRLVSYRRLPIFPQYRDTANCCSASLYSLSCKYARSRAGSSRASRFYGISLRWSTDNRRSRG